VLAERGLGPAHYRALFVIRRAESQPVSNLRRRLGVRKQSLARVLVDLHKAGLIERNMGMTDRRNRLLTLTAAGRAAEQEATAALHKELRKVARRAGPEALVGSYAVLRLMAKGDEETA
jgi:DNA-binding MarR family transcriptional regulator